MRQPWAIAFHTDCYWQRLPFHCTDMHDLSSQWSNGGGFAAPLTAAAEPKDQDQPSAREETTRPPHRSHKAMRVAAWLSAAVVATATIFFLINVHGLRHRVAGQSTPVIHSLAVLPLENLSGDPAQDYFADGVTDELITMLAKTRACVSSPGLQPCSTKELDCRSRKLDVSSAWMEFGRLG